MFDFSNNKFSSNYVTIGDDLNGQGATAGVENEKDNSPKTSKNNVSPMKRRTQGNTGMSPGKSPSKKRAMAHSPNRTNKDDLNTTEKAHDGFQSPTSVTSRTVLSLIMLTSHSTCTSSRLIRQKTRPTVWTTSLIYFTIFNYTFK